MYNLGPKHAPLADQVCSSEYKTDPDKPPWTNVRIALRVDRAVEVAKGAVQVAKHSGSKISVQEAVEKVRREMPK